MAHCVTASDAVAGPRWAGAPGGRAGSVSRERTRQRAYAGEWVPDTEPALQQGFLHSLVPGSARNVGGMPDVPRSMTLGPHPAQRLHIEFSHTIAGEVRLSARAKRFLLGLCLPVRLPHGFLTNFAHDGGDGLVGLEVPGENVGRRSQHTVPKEVREILS
jgi:hypothetical protein